MNLGEQVRLEKLERQNKSLKRWNIILITWSLLVGTLLLVGAFING